MHYPRTFLAVVADVVIVVVSTICSCCRFFVYLCEFVHYCCHCLCCHTKLPLPFFLSAPTVFVVVVPCICPLSFHSILSFFILSEGSISIRKIKIVAEAMNVKRKRPPLYCSVARIHMYSRTHTPMHTYLSTYTPFFLLLSPIDVSNNNKCRRLVNKRMNSKWQHGNKTIHPNKKRTQKGDDVDDATLNDIQTHTRSFMAST